MQNNFYYFHVVTHVIHHSIHSTKHEQTVYHILSYPHEIGLSRISRQPGSLSVFTALCVGERPWLSSLFFEERFEKHTTTRKI